MKYRGKAKHSRRFWKSHDKATYECPDCGATAGSFDVHHIDGNVGNGARQNLVALCHDCHQDRHESLESDDEPEVEGWKRAFRTELFTE